MNRNRRWKKGRRPDADRPRGSPGLEEDTAKPRPDLLVFGYASRVFRDNERATFFDKGRHLIPWMGNEALLIDRYDARGHLHSLQPPDDANRFPDGSLVGNELYGDVRYDELCDEERYRDLRALEQEQQMLVKQRHEVEMEEDYLAAISSPVAAEEEGRVAENGSYGAVGFSYSTPTHPKAKEVLKEEPKEPEVVQKTVKKGKASEEVVEETPFVPRGDFDIPAHISLPQFERIHAIIEKTAFFIADKGPQLEIVIRSKQANNEAFSFLQPKDALYPYYRFLVEAMKSGTYKPSEKPEKEGTPPKEQIKEEPVETSSDEEDDYQTSLFSRLPTVQPKEVAPPPKPAVAFPQLSSGPSIYGSLIQKVQAGLTKPSTEKVKEGSPVSPLTVKSFSTRKPDPKATRVNGTGSVGSPLGVYGTDLDSEVPGTALSRFPPSTVDRSSKTGSRPSSSGPPPEVVTAVEKIANYVIKNGESFEEMIKARHAPDDPKFGFVHGYHPYHGLYMERKDALLDAFRHTLRSSKSIEEPSQDSKLIKEDTQTEIAQKEGTEIKPPPEVNQPEVVPPPLPPALPSYATPLEVDPRIAELKKKALEASLKVKQKIEEREALRVSLVQKALEETKKLAKEAVENEDAEVKVVMNTNRVVAGSFFELIHDETGKKEVKKERRRSRSRSKEKRSGSREERRKSKKEHKERRRRSASAEKEEERSSRREEKKHGKNGTSARKRRSRSREDSEEREKRSKKSRHRRDRRSRSRS